MARDRTILQSSYQHSVHHTRPNRLCCVTAVHAEFKQTGSSSSVESHFEDKAHSVPDGPLVAGVVIRRKEYPGNGSGDGVRAVAIHRDVRERPAGLRPRHFAGRAPHAILMPACTAKGVDGSNRA